MKAVSKLCIAALAVASVSAQATTDAVNYTPGAEFTNGAWSLGWEFTVGASNLNVLALGTFSDPANPIKDFHDVGIFTTTGTLLTEVAVNPALYVQSGDFAYEILSAQLELLAGHTYIVAGETGSENYSFSGTLTNSWDVSWDEDLYISSPTLAFPIYSDGAPAAYFGPNFQYYPAATNTTPSPAAVLPFLVGLAGAVRRRKAA
jgi:hypothetical protein